MPGCAHFPWCVPEFLDGREFRREQKRARDRCNQCQWLNVCGGLKLLPAIGFLVTIAGNGGG